MLHDAVHPALDRRRLGPQGLTVGEAVGHEPVVEAHIDAVGLVERRVKPHVARGGTRRSTRPTDRKSTRLNSSHLVISYAVFFFKKKKKIKQSPVAAVIALFA